jgi:HlyD family secretion protein
LDQGIADVGDARAELENTASAFHAANLRPIREELAIADANVRQAAAAASVMAPGGGQIKHPAPQTALLRSLSRSLGQAIIPGQPVMTLQARGQAWTSFNLREDQLDGLTIGFAVELMPAGASIRFVSDCMQVV